MIFFMKILDIGAGIRWVTPTNPEFDLEEGSGGVPEAYFRWLKRDTAKKVRKVLEEETLEVFGLDLKKPPNFNDKKFHFTGIDADHLGDKQFDALTWLYPNPWQIVRFSNRMKYTYDNPLDVVLKTVSMNLKPEGLLLFETEMPTEVSRDDVHETCAVLQLIRQNLEAVLMQTDKKFKTNDPWRTFGCVYRKK